MSYRREDARVSFCRVRFFTSFLALSLTALAAAACTTQERIRPDETRAAARPPFNQWLPPAPDGPDAASFAFGTPCVAGDDNTRCGTKARVAVNFNLVFDQHDPKRDTPCEMKNISTPISPGTGCVKEDRVYLTAYCLECRTFSRWDMTGIVEEMTDAQLADAQLHVGLPKEPLLRTPDAWKGALSSAAAKAVKLNR